MANIQKKKSVTLLLVAILFSVMLTLGILNYIQTPEVVEVEDSGESASSGEVTLTVENPPVVIDESGGSVSLELVSSEE
ncbi:hypothetical protein ISS05_05170 [Candidatus Woesearchaeota archaeon]|nr:hypothetical protein [Candidatus Woesearchaeota archaeon]